jgi:hypothetical protein
MRYVVRPRLIMAPVVPHYCVLDTLTQKESQHAYASLIDAEAIRSWLEDRSRGYPNINVTSCSHGL